MNASMRTFTIVWFGQFVSTIGSRLSTFALAIWVYEQAGSVTYLSMAAMAASVPGILVSPLAGVLIDRANRRAVMIAADTLAASATVTAVVLVLSGQLELWMVYGLVTMTSLANAFQDPAMTSVVPLLVPKRHLGRASGMVQLNGAVATLLAPALATVLMTFIDISGVLMVDLATFVVGVLTLLVVRIPTTSVSSEGKSRGTVLADVAAGWTYLRTRPGLLGLLTMFAAGNFLIAFTSILYIPLILSFASRITLGTTVSAGGVAMVLATLALARCGLPERKIAMVLGLSAVSGVLIVLLGLRPSIVLSAGSLLVLMCLAPFARAANQVLWQTKIPPDLQGRAFAMRRMSAQVSAPLAYVIVGPLADRVFNPLLVEGGPLAGTVGRIVGVGPERGIGLMFVLAGVFTVLLAAAGWLHPRTRMLEAEIPDAIDEAPAGPIPPVGEPALETRGAS
jgi:MFS family permease